MFVLCFCFVVLCSVCFFLFSFISPILGAINVNFHVYIVHAACYTTQEGLTPLMLAAMKGKCDIVTELLDNGADIHAQDSVSH